VIAVLPLVFLLLVAVHEGGHLVAGALAGFRPCLFIVGPVKFERTSRGWQGGVNRVFPLSGGLVAATPQGLDRLRQRMVGLLAGGPSASLLFGGMVLAGLIAATSRDARVSGDGAVLFVIALVTGLGSLVLGMAALVPGQGHGFSSDGARMLRFLRSGPSADAEVALLSLVGASMAGQRPRVWDTRLVAAALQLDATTSMGAAARILAHLQALDLGDIDRARMFLRTALDRAAALPAMSRPSLLLQAAYFEATHDRDPDTARRHLTSGEGALVSPYARPMAEGAILLAEGDPRAADVLARASHAVSSALDRGSAALAADLIAAMQAQRARGPAADRAEDEPRE
jgi:hypothetical protein